MFTATEHSFRAVSESFAAQCAVRNYVYLFSCLGLKLWQLSRKLMLYHLMDSRLYVEQRFKYVMLREGCEGG